MTGVEHGTSTDESANERARSGKPIGVGIIGLGASTESWAARAHLPALRALPGFEVRGVSASSLASAQAAAARENIPFAFASPAELAAHEAIDLIVVSVRVPLHAAAIDEVLPSGKPIFSEWPLGVNTAEAKALTARAATAGVRTFVGLQSRFNPAIAYLRDLVADGYVGEVLSSTLVGSGGLHGAVIPDRYEYLLDERNGANMRTIVVGHAMEALSYILGEPSQLRMGQATRRRTSRNTTTGAEVPLTAADQVWFSGRVGTGAVLTGHYRGGRLLGDNLTWDILGTEGELRIGGDFGSLQTQDVRISGAHADDHELIELRVPDGYTTVSGLDAADLRPALVAARAYQQIECDLREGTWRAPTWADAVVRHESIDVT